LAVNWFLEYFRKDQTLCYLFHAQLRFLLLQVSYAKATLQQAANYGWAFFMNNAG
jgi:hypothetical protein